MDFFAISCFDITENKWLLNFEPLFFLSHCQGLPNVLSLDRNHPSSNIDTAQCKKLSLFLGFSLEKC